MTFLFFYKVSIFFVTSLFANPKSDQKDCRNAGSGGNGRSDLFCVAKNAGGVPPGFCGGRSPSTIFN
jgi:hypothetical protein